MEETYCEVRDCERPTDGHGPMCSLHTKRKQRGTALHAPIVEKRSLKDRVFARGQPDYETQFPQDRVIA